MKQRYNFVNLSYRNSMGRGWYVDTYTNQYSPLTVPIKGVNDKQLFALIYQNTGTYWYIEKYDGDFKYRLVVFRVEDGCMVGEKCLGLSDVKKLLLPLYGEKYGCVTEGNGLQIVQTPFEEIVHFNWGEKN